MFSWKIIFLNFLKTIYFSDLILRISIYLEIILLILITFANRIVRLIHKYSLLILNIWIWLQIIILGFLLWCCIIGKKSICSHLIAPSAQLTFYFLLRLIIFYFLNRTLEQISFGNNLLLTFSTFQILLFLQLFQRKFEWLKVRNLREEKSMVFLWDHIY